MHTKSITWLTVFLLIALLGITLTARESTALIEARGLWAIDGDTIMVEIPDHGRQEIRYIAINAPALAGALGEQAHAANEELIGGKTIWLELDPTEEGYRQDRDGRLLAHVFLEPVQTPLTSVAVLLVAQGLARLDVWDPINREIKADNDFNVRYADWIIAAQIEAARERRGWWKEEDMYHDSDLVIAAIKQWTDETVYIVNRGTEEIDFAAGWKLTSDPQQAQTLDFSRFAATLILPPGWVLRIHSGPIAKDRRGEYQIQEDEQTIDWYWTGRKIWRNKGDEAWLILSRPGEELQKMYHYSYPLSGPAWE
ncbi:thermonuclease family protein [Candidatus Bipolaricaulota bacterium]|nr:thermonuclease family protein [Candidatus Bipolaricaulota bacterium]